MSKDTDFVQFNDEQEMPGGRQEPVVTLSNMVFANLGEVVQKNCVKYPLWSVQDVRMALQRVIRQSVILRNGFARKETKGTRIMNWYFVFSNLECRGHADYCGCQIVLRGIGLRNQGLVYAAKKGTIFNQLLELGAAMEAHGMSEDFLNGPLKLEKSDKFGPRKKKKNVPRTVRVDASPLEKNIGSGLCQEKEDVLSCQLSLNEKMMVTATKMMDPNISQKQYEKLLSLQRSSLARQRELQNLGEAIKVRTTKAEVKWSSDKAKVVKVKRKAVSKVSCGVREKTVKMKRLVLELQQQGLVQTQVEVSGLEVPGGISKVLSMPQVGGE
jgi:hypothetical protein